MENSERGGLTTSQLVRRLEDELAGSFMRAKSLRNLSIGRALSKKDVALLER